MQTKISCVYHADILVLTDRFLKKCCIYFHCNILFLKTYGSRARTALVAEFHLRNLVRNNFAAIASFCFISVVHIRSLLKFLGHEIIR
jgi:hypothetical protein